MARNRNSVIVDVTANVAQASQQIAGFRSSLLDNFGSMGAAITGVQSAISLVGSTITPVVSAINEATDANLSLINTTNQFMTLTGQTYEGARGTLVALNSEMAKLGQTLPGVATDYSDIAVSISDNLVPATKELDGAFTTEGMNKYAKELAKNFGFIAATTESTSQEIGLVLNRLLTEGTTLEEVARIDALQNNPALISNITKVANEMGIAFNDATVGQRTQILTRASEISQGALDAAASDLSVVISGLNDKIFGSQGLLSLQRIIGGTSEQGGTSVIQELGKLIEQIASPSGPFSSVFTALSGINFDPMVALRDAIISVNAFLPRVGSIASSLINTFKETGASGMTNLITAMLVNLDFNQIGYAIGTGLGKIINLITTYMSNLDYSFIPELLFNIVQGIGVALLALFTTIDYMSLAGALINTAVGSVVVALTTIDMAIGAVFRGLGTAVVAAVSAIAGTIRSNAIGALAVLGNAFGPFYSIIRAVAAAVGAVVGRISSLVSSIRSISIPNAPTVSAIGTRASGQFPGALGSLLQAIITENRNSPNGARPVIANTSELILNRNQQQNLGQLLAGQNDTGNLTVNVYGATNADMIVREIEKFYNRRTRLA